MKKLFISFSLAAISTMVAGAGELVPVLQENFSRCTSTTIQGGYLAENYYFTAEDHADNPGWTSNNAYVSERAIKFSAKTKPAGYIVTPALDFATTTASTVVVRFRAQTWAHKDDLVTVCVQVEGDASTVQKVDGNASTNVSDRNQAPFEMTFTNVPDGAKFRFFPEKKEGAVTDRWFLADVVILEEQEQPAGEHIYTNAGYQRFENLMIGDDSEVRHIAVGAVGLGSDITIEQQEGSAYKVTKAAGWDNRKGGTLDITFDPAIAATHEETLTIKAGNTSRDIIAYGHAKVYAPVADAATDVTPNAFTANWHRVDGCDHIVLNVYTYDQGPLTATDLMFTKYIEGKSNNRALEIFNGTPEDIDLAGYALRMESNGSGGLTFGEYVFADDALIPAGATFTVCNSNYSALRDIANVTIGFNNGGYANITTFTGDDAIGLFAPDGRLIDLLGYESIDVNDEVSGNWGQDKSFYRKTNIYEPTDKFIASQWDVHEMDYCQGYGQHHLDANGPVKRVIKTLTLERGTTSARIEGIPDATTCYYTVQGFSGERKTLVSAEICAGNYSGIADITTDAATAVPVATYDLAGRLIDDATATGVVIVRMSDGSARKQLRR